MVSTDDPETSRLASKFPITVFKRPDVLSTDLANAFDVLKFVCFNQLSEIGVLPELVVLLQATSPLREFGLVSNCVKKMINNKSADRLIELNSLALATGK